MSLTLLAPSPVKTARDWENIARPIEVPHLSQNQCSFVDLSEAPCFGEVRDQGDSWFCTAYAIADIAGCQQGKRISAVELAQGALWLRAKRALPADQPEFDGLTPDEVIDFLNRKGYCEDEDFLSGVCRKRQKLKKPLTLEFTARDNAHISEIFGTFKLRAALTNKSTSPQTKQALRELKEFHYFLPLVLGLCSRSSLSEPERIWAHYFH